MYWYAPRGLLRAIVISCARRVTNRVIGTPPAIRRGPPKTFSVQIRPDDQQRLAVTIRDDAPSERRRRSIEVLEERARTLGAVISVDHDDHGSTMRLELPMYAVSE